MTSVASGWRAVTRGQADRRTFWPFLDGDSSHAHRDGRGRIEAERGSGGEALRLARRRAASQVHAVADDLVPAADPAGAAEGGFAVADAGQHLGPSRRPTLPPDSPGPDASARREPGPPVRLEDRRQTAPQRQPTGQAGLGTVEMNDIGPDRSQHPPQRE